MVADKVTVALRVQAMMFLAETGWRTTSHWQRHGVQVWEVFFADHDKYPQQRALSMKELVKRCVWQETNRLLPKE